MSKSKRARAIKARSTSKVQSKSAAAARKIMGHQPTRANSKQAQVLRLLGLNFGTDVTVISAAPALARTQLEAKRVDAAMLWEPTTTLALRENPQIAHPRSEAAQVESCPPG